ncbi:MAG: winged helix-turn-helix transcriptional regulator [Candidatus Thorarchaeota archaeon]
MTTVKEDADASMTESKDPAFWEKLSHSAKAVLKTLKQLEDNQNLDLFQPGPEFFELKKIVATYRGGCYSAVTRRLDRIVSKGGVDIITSSDLMSIIRDLWNRNISRLTETELKVLEGVLKNPEMSMNDLSTKVGLSYSRTRRAIEQLRATGILKRQGRPDAALLGLDRILIISENPSGILGSPYFTRFLYSDGATPRVFVKGLIPSRKRQEFLQTIRTLRSVSDSTSVWALSSGEPRFSFCYYDKEKKKFEFDPLHFRLLLRAGGQDLTIGSFSIGQIRFPNRFNASEIKIIESLLDDFDMTAQQLVERTGISESTAFRRRGKVLSEHIIRPRPKISIPSLSDRVLGIFSADSAGNIINAWTQLPLSYVSQLTNMDDPRKKKILFATALPAGSARDLIDVLSSEMSRIDDYEVYEISAGTRQNLPVASLYDTKAKQWSFNSAFFDVRNYGICRREASRYDIPLDLA